MSKLSMDDFCLSTIVTIRCQGLSGLQSIVLFILSGSQALLLPILFVTIWKIPNSTLILLSVEIIFFVAFSSWDLAVNLMLHGLDDYRTESTALGIISPLPNLFLQLCLTSYFLSIRSSLPTIYETKLSITIFGGIIAPLIPISLIANTLPSFISLRYYKLSASEVIFTRFTNQSDKNLFIISVDIGLITSIIYIIIIAFVSFSQKAIGKQKKIICILVSRGLSDWYLDFPWL
ncbi:uncharacterized protein L201_007174 [Kwoniella dendrophila CBS 6074]|uniref:Uncharacterized protein n=1 Tax=Kwoniella dendrophila CBS 6074 TaxID=1295534 RepID=A0AAX4K5Y5_9TREE